MFVTADNPFARRDATRHVPQRYEVDEEGKQRVFETIGQSRIAEPGEHVLGLFGVARVNSRTREPMVILREVTEG